MRIVVLLCCLLANSALAGCASVDTTVIAVLAADEADRVQQPLDVEGLEQRVDSICEGCTVRVYDAAGDAAAQAEQVDRAVADSADILILDPVDPGLGESMIGRAGDVPVVAYATEVPGAAWFVGMSEPVATVDGVDSDLEAAREVILRKRDTFAFVPAAEMSAKVADVAVGELAQEPIGGSVEHGGVPSWLFPSVEVTLNDLTSVVVASGAMTLEELCAGATAERCARFGLV